MPRLPGLTSSTTHRRRCVRWKNNNCFHFHVCETIHIKHIFLCTKEIRMLIASSTPPQAVRASKGNNSAMVQWEPGHLCEGYCNKSMIYSKKKTPVYFFTADDFHQIFM
ncbi:hypothetical protein CHARACLAT_021609 [Characodon lateralis]|uniref:Fibronectin type-III domain-containing protein n=1 Tax=Characodon lateralis TaxID=208331 RepID=A0ABU7F4X6_9TELE|nr:hypothetical protein [Characodon lateralis]